MREGPSTSVGGGREGPLKCTRRRHLCRLRFARRLHTHAWEPWRRFTAPQPRCARAWACSCTKACCSPAAVQPHAAQATACLLAFRLESAEAFK